jgi:hypothetical protein
MISFRKFCNQDLIRREDDREPPDRHAMKNAFSNRRRTFQAAFKRRRV